MSLGAGLGRLRRTAFAGMALLVGVGVVVEFDGFGLGPDLLLPTADRAELFLSAELFTSSRPQLFVSTTLRLSAALRRLRCSSPIEGGYSYDPYGSYGWGGYPYYSWGGRLGIPWWYAGWWGWPGGVGAGVVAAGAGVVAAGAGVMAGLGSRRLCGVPWRLGSRRRLGRRRWLGSRRRRLGRWSRRRLGRRWWRPWRGRRSPLTPAAVGSPDDR